MSSSTRSRRFLLDENVRLDLFRFLQKEGYDVARALASTNDRLLAQRTLKERRILVTNDHDFWWYPKHTIFSVILLKVPQYDGVTLISTFTKLMKEEKSFRGCVFTLYPNTWGKEQLSEEGAFQPKK
jgi:hypothetical protein